MRIKTSLFLTVAIDMNENESWQIEIANKIKTRVPW